MSSTDNEYIEMNGFKNDILRTIRFRMKMNEYNTNTTILEFGPKKIMPGIIFVDNTAENANILSFGYHPKLTEPNLAKNSGTFIILQTIIQKMLELREENLIQFKQIRFTDNSSKKLFHVEVQLSDYHRLLNGKTWYQTVLPQFKFVMEEPELQKIFDRDNQKLTNLLVQNVHWSQLFIYKTTFDDEQLEKLWTVTTNKLLIHVFQQLREQMPELLVKNYIHILQYLQIRPIFGQTFIIYM